NAVALEWSVNDLLDLKLSASVGFDSSTGDKNVHKKCKDAVNDREASEQSLSVTIFIIIKISSNKSDKKSWINPIPQSLRLSRPLRIALKKETDDSTIRKYNRFKNEIKNLSSYKVSPKKRDSGK
ncbi:hypothetical protein TSAR_000869, partial [Trichomalopsis sarcophagae]